MSYSFEQTKAGYLKLWTEAAVRPEHKSAAAALAAKIVSNKARYQIVEANDGVPWFIVGCWHYRESDFNFETYLGNGQPLSEITTEVPAGRGPFSSFEAGASDALRGLKGIKWSIERILYETERFNGQGYFSVSPPTNSPYVWSWTTAYTSGKYIRDHVFNKDEVDVQCGCAAILKELEASGAITLEFEAPMPTQAPAPIPTVTISHPATGQQFTFPQINVADIENALKTAGTVLPIVATFFPPLRIVLPFLPIIDGLLQAILEIQTGADVPSTIAKHLEAIAAQVKAAFPPKP